MPKVSVLIVSYNNASTIGACLLSLQQQTFADFDVVLVDNRSLDATRQVIESLRLSLSFPFSTHYYAENLGFAEGNNAALQKAASDLVALLNPDATADPDWLGQLVATMESDGLTGICASKIVVDGTAVIDSAGDGYSRSLRGYKRGEGQHETAFAQPGVVFGACACAALYRRSMIDEIGFFDPRLFLIHEDTDLNLRAQLMGWKVRYVPSATVRHRVRTSIGPMSDTAVYYSLRNAEIVRLKNVPFSVFLRCLPAVAVQLVAEFLYFGLKHRKSIVYLRAKWDAFRMMPAVLKERSRLMRGRKTDDTYLYALTTSVFHPDFLKEKLRKFACR